MLYKLLAITTSFYSTAKIIFLKSADQEAVKSVCDDKAECAKIN
jgi:hypothetical protein